MRLNSLHLCNFRQHIDTRIDFDAGITGIIGPNGSGKTTLLEAIAWALYGMSAARGTRESIRAYKAAPRATVKVELDFELGGHRFLVSRGLTSAEVFLDGAAVPIATSTLPKSVRSVALGVVSPSTILTALPVTLASGVPARVSRADRRGTASKAWAAGRGCVPSDVM